MVDFTPPSRQNQYAILVQNGATLVIDGKTFIDSKTTIAEDHPEGTLAITAGNSHFKQSGHIQLLGDVEIYIQQLGTTSEYGANAIYSTYEGSTIEIGNENTSTTIWTIAEQPDLISAKNGGSVIVKSTKNQLLGSIDTLDSNSLGTKGSEVRLSIEGEGYYWYGDDMTMQNATVTLSSEAAKMLGLTEDQSLVYSKAEGFNELLSILSTTDNGKTLLQSRGIALNATITDQLSLTITNGAQWTYFGIEKGSPEDILSLENAVVVSTIPKRISAITLKDQGIINLYDDNIEDIWKSMKYEDQSLWDLWTDLQSVEHDYVRIGDLKGSGGIFRLDLNSDDHKASDMIFVESSSEAGTHHIEPYRPQDLTSISEDNRLIFALTTAAANSVKFDETENIYGETLYDYELGISSEIIDEKKAEQIAEIESMVSNYDTFTDFDIADFYGGTNWFINRLTITKSAASLAMGSAGFAAYDAAIEMDRRDRRLLQTFKDEETGLWVRARHGERGVKNEYGYQLNGFAVGTDYAFSDTNALGIAFSFEKGDTDFKSVVGDGNMKRYELAVYNTHDFGAPYLDFVGRLGIVKSDYTAYNQSRTLSTSGDFDQKYATLSAEAGYTLEDTNGVFIEPQVQVQLTYLKDYDYASDRNMHVSADSDYVILSRVGLRGGRHFDSESLQGEIYGRADVYHQFTDGQDAIFRDTEQAMFQTWGTNKTFASIGLGSYLKAKSGWGVQFDLEKNLGGKSIDSWMITGQARYEF